MALESLPFWEIMILTLLPITVAMLIFFRVISVFKVIWSRFKQRESVFIEEMGSLLVFIVMLTVIISLINYMIGEAPTGFDIFQFLIIEMLPICVYVILTYVILVQLRILFDRTGRVRR